MKKIYVMLFFALMACTVNAQAVWDGTSAAWTAGDGSKDNPFVIETGQNLAYLSEQVRKGETYEGKYFRLSTDLNMGSSEGLKFTPIGLYDDYINSGDDQQQGGDQEIIEASKAFKGVFDGGNHSIDNIYVYYKDEESVGGTGLFACIDGDAVIKNLEIGENSTVEGLDLTGAIVGFMNNGTVENCSNKGTVYLESGLMCGGLVGGGYKGKILNSFNRGMVMGTSYAAGIIGFADEDFTVDNCYNNAMISYSGFTAAGIVGYLASGHVSNCYSAGIFSGDDVNNGVIGDTDPGVEIVNCYYLQQDGVSDSNPGVVSKTESEMKSPEFLALLNGSQNPAPWVADAGLTNEGYPVLAWQQSGSTGISKVYDNSALYMKVNGRDITVSCDAAGIGRIVVADMSGRIVSAGNIVSGETLNLSSDGAYLVKVIFGNKQLVRKIFIK